VRFAARLLCCQAPAAQPNDERRTTTAAALDASRDRWLQGRPGNMTKGNNRRRWSIDRGGIGKTRAPGLSKRRSTATAARMCAAVVKMMMAVAPRKRDRRGRLSRVGR
jgi:hypothetical protein